MELPLSIPNRVVKRGRGDDTRKGKVASRQLAGFNFSAGLRLVAKNSSFTLEFLDKSGTFRTDLPRTVLCSGAGVVKRRSADDPEAKRSLLRGKYSWESMPHTEAKLLVPG